MKVLYVIDSLARAGAEQSLVAILPALRDHGVTMEIASVQPPSGLAATIEAQGVRVHSLAGRGGRAGTVARARRLIRDRGPDLVHTTLAEANIAGRTAAALARVPVVSSLVNVQYDPDRQFNPSVRTWKLRIVKAADRFTARRVARFHAITRHVADEMASRLGIPPERIEVIPRGRDASLLGANTADRRQAARAELGVGTEDALVLAVARHEYQKGLDVLLESMALLRVSVPHARLVVAGRSGSQTAELTRLVRDHGLVDHVRFLGPRDDVPDLLVAADVFVLPSRWEGLGSVLLEAMALRAPIVVSDLPPVREILPGPTYATFVPPGDAAAFASALTAALAHPAEAAARAGRAHARFHEHFTVEKVGAAMVVFYHRALAAA